MKYKTEGISPKDFRNYQNLIDLFKDLRDGNINPRERLKYQINFKSDLGETKKGNKKSKSKGQINVKELRKIIIEFFRDYSILISEAKSKAKYGRRLS